MDSLTLRKVQFEQLEIAKEIIRICKKHNIKVFMDSGTLIGAVRHKGFIPWDDDLDLGMLRADYDKFSEIAPRELREQYYWQTWDNEDNYPLPFGKVRKKGTVYLEKKAGLLSENGFYVDVLPYDYAPEDEKERTRLRKKQDDIYSCILMKCRYTPWIIDGRINPKSRLRWLYYQMKSISLNRINLIRKYEELTRSIKPSKLVYQQTGRYFYNIDWFKEIVWIEFENTRFPAIAHYHDWLTKAYGDYMTPPPEDQRESRHEIYKIDFGDGKE